MSQDHAARLLSFCWALVIVSIPAACTNSDSDGNSVGNEVLRPLAETESRPIAGTAVVSTTGFNPGQGATPGSQKSTRQQELAARKKGVDSKTSAWSEFRGPNRSGISEDVGVPLKWSDTENILWKVPLPGRGASSPIVWGDHIYVTAYSGYGLVKDDPARNLGNLNRHLLCVDRRNGRLLWKSDRNLGPMHSEHNIVDFLSNHGYASGTPVADESGVYVYYGTDGVVAYTHDGKQKWERKLGKMYSKWGTATSPILFKNLVIVHADIEAQALVAMDKQTGREVWQVPTGDRDSWSTPLIAEVNGQHELVFHHSRGEPAIVAAVDPLTGSSRWQCRVLEKYLCPSPIAHDGTIYLLAYQRGAAVRAGGRGDVTDSHLMWTITKGTEVGTPIYYNGHLYWAHQENGIVYCVNAKTGATVSSERLSPESGLIYASGVLAEGRIYYVSRENGTYVVAAKPRFELLAHNVIRSDGSIFNGTPAICQGQLLLRSDKYLYCIGKK
jgi:outer membrane protein assembly factor BamB